LASYFYREIIDLLNAYSNSKNPQDRLLLHYDLERLALQFFGPKGGPQLYNSSSDAALFANIILLAEYSTGKQVEPSLLTNPSYEKYRGTQKSTYVFASELLKNSIFTDLNRFEAAISPTNFNELGKTLSTDPLALLIGTVETISILSAQSQGLDAKVPQKGAIAIQTASIKRPNKRPYSTANLELTEYFKKLVKANNATDKNEAFGTNLPLLPLNTDETRSKQSRSTKEAPSDSKAPSRPNPGTKKGKGK
jgi:hypothetical protein